METGAMLGKESKSLSKLERKVAVKLISVLIKYNWIIKESQCIEVQIRLQLVIR